MRAALEVFLVFLRLGLTSFGGPVAHLGYFRETFVARRRWLDDARYAELVALCQFLPGPASSQVGMAIGMQRAGAPGLLAAWLAFTTPSALLLFAFALGVTRYGDALGYGWLAGMKAAAVAVVAHAVLGMARTLAVGARRAGVAIGAAVLALAVPGALAQVAVIALGAAAGLLLVRDAPPAAAGASAAPGRWRLAAVWLALFVLLLAGLPLLAAWSGDGALALFDGFYRAGSLVFGGGHVVLPLLRAEVVDPGLVTMDDFLAGYGAAQAVPGPLFTFAAYLGAVMQQGPSGAAGALLAIVAIFLPSALLIAGALPFWERLRAVAPARRALAGVNAAVVGLLAAVLINPVVPQGVPDWRAALAALAAFGLLLARVPAWAVVLLAALAGAVLL